VASPLTANNEHSMNEAAESTIDLIRNGMSRVSKDFGSVLEPLGFKRTKTRVWTRRCGDLDEHIGMLREGAQGKPFNASVRLRLQFFVRSASSDRPPAANGVIYGDKLRDSSGNGYHLRFNAATLSTYDRCVADLQRIVVEQAIPWFTSRQPVDG
jgi:hypothetical protein